MSEERYLNDADYHALIETWMGITGSDIETAMRTIDNELEEDAFRATTRGQSYRVPISGQAITLMALDEAIKADYGEAILRELNRETPLFHQLGFKPKPLTRRARWQRWVKRHTPHVYVGEKHEDCECW